MTTVLGKPAVAVPGDIVRKQVLQELVESRNIFDGSPAKAGWLLLESSAKAGRLLLKALRKQDGFCWKVLRKQDGFCWKLCESRMASVEIPVKAGWLSLKAL